LHAILARELGLDELEVLADYEGRDRLASMVDSTLRDLRVAQRSRINKMTYWEAVRAVEEQLRGTMLPETERRQAAIHIATKVDRSSILAESLADPSILNGEYANTWLSGPSTSQLGAAIQEWCMLRITTDADQIEAAMESAHLLDVEAGFVVLQAMTWETADTLALVKEYLWKPCEPRQTGRTEAETPNNAVLKAARKSSSEHKMRLTAIVDGLKLDLHCQANGSAVVAAAIKSTGNSTSTTTGAEHTHAVVAAMARQREDIQMLLATGNLASIKPLIDGKDVLMVVLQPVGQPATAILTNVRV
jgi:hypothetical protein